MPKVTKNNIESTREKLNELRKKNQQDEMITVTNFIREIFDDIHQIIISREAKTEDVYNTIKSDIGDISYDNFRDILRRIRKEKGIRLRKRTPKTQKSTTPLPLLKTDKSVVQSKKPSDKLSDVNMDEIILQQEIDRSKYTVNDWSREWDSILSQYKSVRTPKEKYVVLGGDPKDVEKYTDSLSDIRIVSNMATNLFTRISNQYRRIIGK